MLILAHFIAGRVDAAGLWYNSLQWDGAAPSPRLSAIHAMDADGNNERLVVDLGGDSSYPLPSSDGNWLYFQSNSVAGTYAVYRSRVDGTEVAQVSDLTQLDPAWQGGDAYGSALSGDGSTIVYTIHNGTASQMVVAHADGTAARLVSPDFNNAYMAGLNHEGDKMVFSGPIQNYQLISTAVAEVSVLTLTPLHADSYVPQFTPDGNTIVFVRGNGDIYTVDAGGAQVQQLTTGNNYYSLHWSALDTHGSTDGPDISPDGTQIAYIGMVEGVSQVHTMNLDGSNQQQLTFGDWATGRVRWSPDGQQLAFVGFVDQYPQLFVMNADGSNLSQLTSIADGGVLWVEWQVPVNVPEPATSISLLLGAGMVMGWKRRQLRRSLIVGRGLGQLPR
jgi:Tol biopolymer transport system component